VVPLRGSGEINGAHRGRAEATQDRIGAAPEQHVGRTGAHRGAPEPHRNALGPLQERTGWPWAGARAGTGAHQGRTGAQSRAEAACGWGAPGPHRGAQWNRDNVALGGTGRTGAAPDRSGAAPEPHGPATVRHRGAPAHTAGPHWSKGPRQGRTWVAQGGTGALPPPAHYKGVTIRVPGVSTFSKALLCAQLMQGPWPFVPLPFPIW
jgi:hypothetical protein